MILRTVVQDGGMDGWKRLGEEVIKRRVELGHITQQAFAADSRLSSRLLSDLENGRRTSYDPATLVRLERALRWVPGSVQLILDGGQPTPLPDERPTLVVHGPDEWSLTAMLIHSGLDPADADRILDYIKVRRAQQHQQLADEVYDLIREAGGTLPPRPRGRDRSGDDAPHLYLDRDVPQGLGGNARVPHGDLPQ